MAAASAADDASASVGPSPSLAALDPSLSDDYRPVFDREVPIERRLQTDDSVEEIGTLEALRVKVLVQGDEAAPSAVKMELTSEADLFFHFSHVTTASEFPTLCEEQKLMIDFAEYPNVLCRVLNQTIKDPHTYLAVFVMHQEGHARLDIIENVAFRFIELISCDFARTEEETTRRHVTYRYNSLKSRLTLMQTRLQDVQKLVQAKSPALLVQIQKQTGSLTSPYRG